MERQDEDRNYFEEQPRGKRNFEDRGRRRDNFRDDKKRGYRNNFHGDRDDAPQRRNFSDEKQERRTGGTKFDILSEIMELDEQILHLISKRAQKIAVLERNRKISSDFERRLRMSWEANTAKLFRDTHMSRELFVLIQGVKSSPSSESSQTYYNLFPKKDPVNINLSCPINADELRFYLILAAAAGQSTMVSNAALTNATIGFVKSFNQMGTRLRWEENGDILCKSGSPMENHLDKVIHVGSDPLNLWLIIAFSVGFVNHLKIMGESELRTIDLSSLRRFLPLIGTRLSNAIPSQDGLPVRLECSGMIPEEITIPEELPSAFTASLLLASAFWEKPCKIILPSTSDKYTALALKILSETGAEIIRQDNAVTIRMGTANFPDRKSFPMDPVIASTLLMFPGFNGGKSCLKGSWGTEKPYQLADKLMDYAGLSIIHTQDETICKGKQRETHAPSAEDISAILMDCPDLLPLTVLITAAAVYEGEAVSSHNYPEDSFALVQDFLLRCGIYDDNGTWKESEDHTLGSWIAPSAPWAMIYALSAFIQPNQRIANPGIVMNLYPVFWNIFNTLPNPTILLKKEENIQEEKVDETPARRRIIAEGIFGELPPDSSPDDYS